MKYILGIMLATAGLSCKKQLSPQPAASLNVINVAYNAGSIKVNPFNTSLIYATFPEIGYGSNAVYTLSAGSPRVQIVPADDTLHPLFDQLISTQSKDIYSMYVLSNGVKYETLLLKDTIPSQSDNSTGIRFMNCALNCPPVTINITSTPETAEFSNVRYKQITPFKTYSGNATNKSYDFEIRNANTGDVVATYGLNIPLSFNVTLILVGIYDASGNSMLDVLRVNNY